MPNYQGIGKCHTLLYTNRKTLTPHGKSTVYVYSYCSTKLNYHLNKRCLLLSLLRASPTVHCAYHTQINIALSAMASNSTNAFPSATSVVSSAIASATSAPEKPAVSVNKSPLRWLSQHTLTAFIVIKLSGSH